MHFINGQYSSTLVIHGKTIIISRIGGNRVFYHCITRRIEQIGMDKVTYDEKRGCIATVRRLDVLYDIDTNRMSSIGALSVQYDEKTGCIVSIGDASVSYVEAPQHYEPMQGELYSPIKTDAEAQAAVSNLQPIGLSFESANRQKMAEFIEDLSNESLCESALFKIEHIIQEERRSRAKNDHFSDGYCSEALKLAAVKKIVPLLRAQVISLRAKAQLALLALFNHIENDDKPEFLRQINQEASCIIDAMMTAMSISLHALKSQKVIAILKKEIKNALNLFSILSLEKYYSQHSIFSKKKGMFQNVGADQYKLDALLQTLQKRAQENSGGASEQTLSYFVLSKG